MVHVLYMWTSVVHVYICGPVWCMFVYVYKCGACFVKVDQCGACVG